MQLQLSKTWFPALESNLTSLNKAEDAVPSNSANPHLEQTLKQFCHVHKETGTEMFAEMQWVMRNKLKTTDISPFRRRENKAVAMHPTVGF